MLYEHMDLLESIGLDLLFAAIFFFIGMAIRDVLKQGNVPPFGRKIVWLVLFLGCAGFITKADPDKLGRRRYWLNRHNAVQQSQWVNTETDLFVRMTRIRTRCRDLLRARHSVYR